MNNCSSIGIIDMKVLRSKKKFCLELELLSNIVERSHCANGSSTQKAREDHSTHHGPLAPIGSMKKMVPGVGKYIMDPRYDNDGNVHQKTT